MPRFTGKLRLLVALLAFWCGGVGLAAPANLSYGGRLTAADGSPLTGPVDLAFAFFDAAKGGHALRGAPLEVRGVALTGGVFQVELALTATDLDAVFGGGGAVFVEVTDVTHGKTYPRQKFLAVPYALRVPVDGQTVTYDAQGQLTVGPQTAPGANQFLTKDGSGNLVWGTPSTNATQIAGAAVATGTPTPGTVLKYVGGQWQAVPEAGVNRGGDVMSGFLGIGTTSAQTALDVAGVLTQRAGAVPGVAPAGEGRIYFDSSSNQFMVSQNGGAYAPLGTVTAGAITQVSAGTGLSGGGTTGNVTVGLASVGTAGTYTRVLTDAYGRVTAGGTLTAADLPTIPVGMISGTLGAAQVAAIPVAQLAGTLATAQLPSVPMTQLSGTLTAAQLPTLSEAQITSGTLAVALGGTGATSFPSGGLVVGAGSLPLSTVSAASQYQLLQEGGSGPVFGAVELGQSAAVSGTLAVAHLPPIPAGLVTGSFAASQISGTLAAAQVGPMPASQITGTLAAAQIGAIPVAQLSGTFTAAQLPSIPATSITGSLGAAQISGTLAAAQIGPIPVSQVTGTLAATQVASIPVTQLTGTLTTAQLPSIPTSQITGTLAGAQLGSHSAALITSGTLAVAQGGTGATSAAANQVFAAPNGSTGAPSFRSLVAADYPAMVGDSGAGGTQGAVPAPPSGSAAAGKYLGADGTWSVPAGGGSANWAAPGAIGSATPNSGAFTSAGVNIGTTSAAGVPFQVNGINMYAVASTTPTGIFDVTSATGNMALDFGLYSSTNIAWIQSRALTSATFKKLVLNPQGGGVGINLPASQYPLSTLDVPGGVSIGSYAGNLGVAAPSNGLIVSGNVGIGSATPGAPLAFAGATGDKIHFVNNGNYDIYGIGVMPSEVRSFSGNSSGSRFTFGYLTSGTGAFNEWMRVSNGTVAIGTTSASSPLTVDGVIESTSGGIKFPDGTVQLSSATSGTNNSILSGFPDIVVCVLSGTTTYPFYMHGYSATSVVYRMLLNNVGDYYVSYNPTTGAYASNVNMAASDCVANSWSISQLTSMGRAYNIIKGPAAQWLQSGTTAYYNAGSVGIGTSSPGVALDVAGGIRAGSSTTVTTCGSGQANGEGTTRYNYTNHSMEYCNGTAWQSLQTGPGGQVFTASGTFTPSVSGRHKIIVTGGGGGGGGWTSSVANGSGGGAGGTAIYYVTLTAGTGYTVTVGGGGAAGVSGGNGGAGTASSVVIGGTTVTANGGAGGGGTGTAAGVGGTAANGSMNVNGGDGMPAYSDSHGGTGGASYWGGGGRGAFNSAGGAGVAYGSGGGGGSGANGGAGAPGVVVIEW